LLLWHRKYTQPPTRDADAIFALIDAMPMRQDELSNR
jgi:hypothetical protein